jgi:hypothetical protein
MKAPLKVTEEDILSPERVELLMESINRSVEMLNGAVKSGHNPNIQATAHVLQVWLEELEAHGKASWEAGI